ncbi:MAG TPA: hypothetical protein VF484_05500, partial [Candidatus Limnocylindrales bacterium]
MHDQLLERRLRSALHHEADGLPFTITAAELERRAVVRRRSIFGRRVTLLLAAVVAASLLAVGAMGGMFRQTVVAPTTSMAPTPTASEPAASAGPVALPDLDTLVGTDPATVVLAQAHGPADGPGDLGPGPLLPTPHVDLGTLPGGFVYTVDYGCRASGSMELQVGTSEFSGLSTVRCDGAMHEQTVSDAADADLQLAFADQASWRIVVHRPTELTEPGPILVLPPAEAGREELARWDGNALDAGAPTLRDTGLLVQAIGAVPTRPEYRFDVLCTVGGPVHLIIGDTAGPGIDARTETVLACDPTNPRSIDVGAAEP